MGSLLEHSYLYIAIKGSDPITSTLAGSKVVLTPITTIKWLSSHRVSDLIYDDVVLCKETTLTMG